MVDGPDQTIPNSFFENFWGTDGNDEEPEDNEVYDTFFQRNERLDAKIIGFAYEFKKIIKI